MNPAEKDISMKDIQNNDTKTYLKDEISYDNNISCDNIVISTQSSLNSCGNLNLTEEISNFSEHIENAQNFYKSVKDRIIPYSKHDLDEKYSFERNLAESELCLIKSRKANYFDKHIFIKETMREILIDWIMELCSNMKLKRGVCHSAVVLIDIFLSKISDLRTNKLQLLGVTCLIIAAKCEVNKLTN